MTGDEVIERIAKAWLKRCYYDIEPEMYESLDDFWGDGKWETLAGDDNFSNALAVFDELRTLGLLAMEKIEGVEVPA